MLISKWAWKKSKPKKLFRPRSGRNSFLGFKLNRAYPLRHIYIDCLVGAGTLSLGHNHPVVIAAIKDTLDSGLASAIPPVLPTCTARR